MLTKAKLRKGNLIKPLPPNSNVFATETDTPFISKEFGHPGLCDEDSVIPGYALTLEPERVKLMPHSSSTAKNSTPTRAAKLNEPTFTDE